VFERRKDGVSQWESNPWVIAWDRCSPCFLWEQIGEAGSILEMFRVLRDAESVIRDQCDH
jgi:hypothetical protein